MHDHGVFIFPLWSAEPGGPHLQIIIYRKYLIRNKETFENLVK